MQKISYINQMNGFLDRMSEDTLPANAVMLYLMLFKSFNRACWRQEMNSARTAGITSSARMPTWTTSNESHLLRTR